MQQNAKINLSCAFSSPSTEAPVIFPFMSIDFSLVRGLLFDLDGTLTVDGVALPGIANLLGFLAQRGIPYRICTNTTTLSMASMSTQLRAAGLAVKPEFIFSAPIAAREYLRHRRPVSCWLLLSDDTRSDFTEFRQDEEHPEVIVIGDIGDRWDYALMTRLFRLVRAGAELVVLHKGKYWLTRGEEKLDIGAFIVGLEYATGCTAKVIGKPSRQFFELALSSLGLPQENVVMIGDDLDNDVAGGQAVGLKAVLVQTGKTPAPTSRATPDLNLASAADLVQLLR